MTLKRNSELFSGKSIFLRAFSAVFRKFPLKYFFAYLSIGARLNRGEVWRRDLKSFSLTIVFSTLYAVMVVVFAPISFGVIQLRVADCLIPLSALFGWPSIFGVTVGCFIGNAYAAVGWCDYVLGPSANLLAGYTVFKLRRKAFIGCMVGANIIGLIVGGYLWLFLPVPKLYGLEKAFPWLISVLSISVSSAIAMSMGYLLLKAFRKPVFSALFKAYGLTVYLNGD